MKHFLIPIIMLFLTSCSPTYEEKKHMNKIDLENSSKLDLNYDLNLCESFVKNNKYKFLTSNDLPSLLYMADKKDEYETTIQFQERQNKKKDNLIKKIQQKTGSDYILYSNNSLQTRYDPDSAILYVKSYWIPMNEGLVHIEMRDKFIPFGGEKRQNAFGATVDVAIGAYNQLNIYLSPFSNETLSKYHRRKYLYYTTDEIYWPQANPKEISIDPQKAKEFRENLRLLVVADPNVSYYALEDTRYDEATFSSPVSGMSIKTRAVLKPITACYYNKKTKEVYSLFNNNYSNIGINYIDWSNTTNGFNYNESYFREVKH